MAISAQLQGRLSGWWSAWKYVVVLALLLLASIAVNVWQWKRAITAPLRAEVAGLEEAAKTSLELTSAANERERKLLAAADIATGQLSQAGTDYRRAVRNRPLEAPQCAPGQERMDAVNKALGTPRAE